METDILSYLKKNGGKRTAKLSARARSRRYSLIGFKTNNYLETDSSFDFIWFRLSGDKNGGEKIAKLSARARSQRLALFCPIWYNLRVIATKKQIVYVVLLTSVDSDYLETKWREKGCEIEHARARSQRSFIL